MISPPSVPGGDTSRPGPPWERPGPAFSRFLDTTRGVLLETTAFFRQMRREGGLGPPLTYGIMGTLAGGIVGALYQLMLSASMGALVDPSEMRGHVFASLFSSGCVVVVVPIVAVLSIFIGSAIYHVMLMLLGAARRPFETTIRVVAYAMGATSLLQIVPVCGGIIAGVWAIVASVIGLAQSHEIPTGKAAAAVLIPIVVCCVLTMLLYAAIFAVIIGRIIAEA